MLTLALPAYAQAPQEEPAPQSRSFMVNFVNKKGKPVDAEDFYLTHKGSKKPVQSTAKGKFVITDVIPGDTLNIIIGRALVQIPMDSLGGLVLAVNRNRLFDYDQRHHRMVEMPYASVMLSDVATPVGSVDVSGIGYYRDLASFLSGKVAGVSVQDNGGEAKLYIRGNTRSFLADQSALIIVDGIPEESFDRINSSLTPSDVKSITIDKDGSIYGSRGSNGVVIITTVTAEPGK